MDNSKKKSVLSIVFFSGLLVYFDISAVEFMLPNIAVSLGTSIEQTTWLLSSYLFAFVGFLIPFGYIADLWSRKKVFLLGLFLFAVFSAAIAVSESIALIITFRFMQGVSSAMLACVAPAFIVEYYGESDRGNAFTVVAASVALGYLLGPNLGGLLVEMGGWQMIFWVNVPIMLVLLIVSTYQLSESSHLAEGVTLKELDVTGMISFLIILGTIIVTMNYYSQLPAWAIILLMLVIAAAAYMVYLGNQKKRFPAFDLYLMFYNKPFLFTNLVSLFSFIGAYVIAYIMPFFVVNSDLGLDVLGFGILLTAFPAGFVFGSPLGGILLRFLDARQALLIAQFLVFLAAAQLLSLTHESTMLHIGISSFLVGLSRGAYIAPFNTHVMSALPVYQLAAGSSMVALFQNMGMMIGIALAGALLVFVTDDMNLSMIRETAESISRFQDTYLVLIATSVAFSLLSFSFCVATLRDSNAQFVRQ